MITDTYDPCVNGIVDAVLGMAKGLKDAGHTVHLLALSDVNGVEIREGIIVHKFKAQRSQVYQDFMLRYRFPVRRVFKIAKKEKFDVIHSNLHLCLGICGLLLSKIKKIPLIMTFHTLIPHYLQNILIDWNTTNSFNKPKAIELLERLRINKVFYRSLYALVWWWLAYFNMGSWLTTPSEFAKKILNENGIGKHNTVVVPNPITIGKNSLPAGQKSIDNEEVLSKSKKKEYLILHSGRLSVEKKVDVLIKALKYIKYDYKCVITSDGPIVDYLKQLAIDEGVSDKINFTGFISRQELNDYYDKADIFVAPANYDTFNLCVAEALVHKKPVIIDKNSGATDYVKQNINGIIVQKNNPRNYAKEINHLLENKELRIKLSQAPDSVHKMTNIKNIVKKLEHLYLKPKKTKFLRFLKDILKFIIGTAYAYIILIICDKTM